MKRRIWRMAVLSAAWAALGQADTLELKDGTRLEGKVLMTSKQLMLVRLPSGEQREVDPAAVQRIVPGPASVPAPAAPPPAARPASNSTPAKSRAEIPAAPAPSAPPAAVPALKAPDPDARRKLAAELQEKMGWMDKEPLEPWPEREPNSDIATNEPPKAIWKMQMADGSIVYSETKPANRPDDAKVWQKSRGNVNTTTWSDGHKRHFIAIPEVKWVRVYWYEKRGDWLEFHPNYRVFKERTDQVTGFLETLQAAVSKEQAQRARTLWWYELLNARAGAPRPEAEVRRNMDAAAAELKSVAEANGRALSLGGAVWQAYELSIKSEEKITPDATDAERLEWARQRQALCRKMLEALAQAGLPSDAITGKRE